MFEVKHGVFQHYRGIADVTGEIKGGHSAKWRGRLLRQLLLMASAKGFHLVFVLSTRPQPIHASEQNPYLSNLPRHAFD